MKRLIYFFLLIPAVIYGQPGSPVQDNKEPIRDGIVLTRLSLDTCKILAMDNNYSIKESSNEVLQSEQVRKNAFTAYFPKVSGGFSALKMSDYLVKASIPQMNLPVYDGIPAHIPLATQFTYFPGMPINLVDYMNFGYAIAAQPVFTGGRLLYGNRLAKTGYEISNEKLLMTETEVLVKTEELYWNVIALSEKLVTIDSYRKMLESLSRDVALAYNAGLVQKTDLLKVQLKQNELEANRLKLVNGIELSKKALCQHIGISFDNTVVLADSVPLVENPVTLFVNPEEAVKSRNEYIILKKAVQAEELQKKIVLGENLPQVAVGVAGAYTDIMDKTNTIGMAFATLNIPISDWWGGTHKLKQSNAKIENATYKFNETAELLVLQITQMQNEMSQNYFNIENAGRSVEQARENLRVTNDNYQAGITGMSDLLEAQSLYQGAMDGLTEAKCNYQISRAQYLQAINNYR